MKIPLRYFRIMKIKKNYNKHLSLWRKITVAGCDKPDINFELDEQGKLKKKFRRSQPRNILYHLNITIQNIQNKNYVTDEHSSNDSSLKIDENISKSKNDEIPDLLYNSFDIDQNNCDLDFNVFNDLNIDITDSCKFNNSYQFNF